MTNYYVSTIQSVSGTNENAQDMTGSDNLFVSSTGELVALGSGAVSGIYLDSGGTQNTVTVDGEVYCAAGDAVYSKSAGLQLQVNGVLYGGVNGVDVFGPSDITVGAHGQISTANNGIILESASTTDTVVVDGEVQAAQEYGIYSDADGSITVGASGTVSGNTYGIYLDASSASEDIKVNGEVDSSLGSAVYSKSANLELAVNGTLSGASGVDSVGYSNIVVGAHGEISAAGPAIDLETTSTGSTVVVDGEVLSSSGNGIFSSSVSDITIGAHGTVSAYDSGIFLDAGSAGSDVTNDGMIESTDPESNNTYSDVFIHGAGDQFDNAGTIMGTIGPVAIDATGVLFINSGTITSPSGVAIALYGNATGTTIHNSGTITEGLQNQSSQGTLDLENSGTWTAPYGIDMPNGDNTLTNSGTIHAPISMGAGSDSFLTNSGKVLGNIAFGGSADHLTNSNSITGNIAMGTGDDVLNSGAITGNLTYVAGANQLTNTGTISGNITFNGTQDTFTNSGTITGAVTFGASDSVTNNGAIHGSLNFGLSDTIANDGTVYGTVTIGQNDHFTNTGTIHGNIDAGTYDQITVNPGTLLGEVVAQNNDSFHFAGGYGAQDISGFVASGTGHDTLYFSTNDFANYTALEAHMTQASGNVLITLDPADVVTLVGVTLSSLSSTDFAFS